MRKSASTPNQEGAVIELLLRDEAYPVCSPDYQRRHDLYREEDLKASQLLQDNQLQRTCGIGWAIWLPADEQPVGDTLQFDSTVLAIEAAIMGTGVALAPHNLVQHEIMSNRLVRLFSRSVPIPGGYCVAHLKAVAEQPMVAAFLEGLFAEASVNRALLESRRTEAEVFQEEAIGSRARASGASLTLVESALPG